MKRRERVNKEQVTAKICNNLFFHTGLETNIHFKFDVNRGDWWRFLLPDHSITLKHLQETEWTIFNPRILQSSQCEFLLY